MADWIPMEKAKPEKNGTYWVTEKDGEVYLVNFAHGEFPSTCTAWMPAEVPAPYEPLMTEAEAVKGSMMTVQVKFKRLTDTAIIPTRGSAGAAGYDIYADIPEGRCVIVRPQSCVSIPTGFATEIPSGYFGAIYARSGLARDRGLRPAQGTSVIDEDYRGEWIVLLYNDSDEPQKIYQGHRIAQVVFHRYEEVEFIEDDNLSGTGRGTGGLGSTGV